MFAINTTPSFTHDVTIRIPADDGFVEQKGKVRFRLVSDDELEQLADDVKAIVNAIVEGFPGGAEIDGKKLEDGDELKAAMLSMSAVRTALLVHYRQAAAGARLGN